MSRVFYGINIAHIIGERKSSNLFTSVLAQTHSKHHNEERAECNSFIKISHEGEKDFVLINDGRETSHSLS